MTQRSRFPVPAPVAAVFVTLALALSAVPGHGQQADVFEVGNVAVDVTADTAAAAREQALAQGERDAFDRLVRRLVLRDDWDRVPALDGEALGALVQDFGVADEKTSPVRYIARLEYRFRPRAVRALFLDHEIAFAETYSKTVLVLPLYREVGRRPVLWDGPNPWLDAWRDLPPGDGLVAVLLPLGDLTDIAAIDAGQAARGDLEHLQAVAGRYGANDTLVAIAERSPADGAGAISVSVTRHAAAREPTSFLRSFPFDAGEAPQAFRQAAASVVLEVEEAWKRDNRLRFGREATMAVTVPVGSLEDWLAVRRRLAGSAVVRRVAPVLMARDRVRLVLHYLGDARQLAVALEQSDLVLSGQEGERVLRLAKTRTPR